VTTRFFKHPRAIERFRRGPLAGHIDAFAGLLFEQGYSRVYARNKLWLLRDLGRWLDRHRLRVADVNEGRLADFARDRSRRGRSLQRGNGAMLEKFLAHLRKSGTAPTAASRLPQDATSRLERAFLGYLAKERGVCEATIDNYRHEVVRFLAHRRTRGALSPRRIGAKDLNDFVLRRARQVGPRRAKLTVTALRSFCQFLRFRGDLTHDLSGAILTVPNWRLTSVPPSLAPSEVRRLLRQCDHRTPTGQRNFTILLILARLGLRASEIMLMTLDDIDWEAGEVVVRGKGSRHERLPLPRDVGAAMATYLRRWRPRCPTRRLFVRLKAPIRGFKTYEAVSSIVKRALARAGLRPPTRGAHLLRFTLATNLLRRGGSLAEVAEILRHRHPDTTALYAKVDVRALRTVAPRWPGGPR
jgi:site-specific recombinase XerD